MTCEEVFADAYFHFSHDARANDSFLMCDIYGGPFGYAGLQLSASLILPSIFSHGYKLPYIAAVHC